MLRVAVPFPDVTIRRGDKCQPHRRRSTGDSQFMTSRPVGPSPRGNR